MRLTIWRQSLIIKKLCIIVHINSTNDHCHKQEHDSLIDQIWAFIYHSWSDASRWWVGYLSNLLQTSFLLQCFHFWNETDAEIRSEISAMIVDYNILYSVQWLLRIVSTDWWGAGHTQCVHMYASTYICLHVCVCVCARARMRVCTLCVCEWTLVHGLMVTGQELEHWSWQKKRSSTNTTVTHVCLAAEPYTWSTMTAEVIEMDNKEQRIKFSLLLHIVNTMLAPTRSFLKT